MVSGDDEERVLGTRHARGSLDGLLKVQDLLEGDVGLAGVQRVIDAASLHLELDPPP